MQARSQRTMAPILGIGLIALGLLVLGARLAGVDHAFNGADWWPLFVIAPGIVLFAAAFAPAPPKGLGFAIAGAIVMAAGGILLVQHATDRYDTWAYAWALIPGAAGLGIVAYGLVTGVRNLLRPGLLLAGIAAALLVVGAWYFEPVLTEGREPIDLGSIWPVAVIVVGAAIALSAFRRTGGEAHG